MWFNLAKLHDLREAYTALFEKKVVQDETVTVSLSDYQCPKCIMYAGGIGVMKVNDNNNGFICNNCGYRQTYEQRRETNNK